MQAAVFSFQQRILCQELSVENNVSRGADGLGPWEVRKWLASKP